MAVRGNQVYLPELLFRVLVLVIAATAMLLSFVLTIDNDGNVYFPLLDQRLPNVCGSRRFLGVDCPGCGMSRAFISISNFEIDKALAFNSASLIVYCFVAMQIPWHTLQIFQTFYRKGPVDTWWTLIPPIGVIVWVIWCYVL